MTTISRIEFDKKVEMEFAYLTYQEHMPEHEARQKAYETVSQKFTTS